MLRLAARAPCRSGPVTSTLGRKTPHSASLLSEPCSAMDFFKAAGVLFGIGSSYYVSFLIAQSLLGEGELSRVVAGVLGTTVMLGIGIAARRDK